MRLFRPAPRGRLRGLLTFLTVLGLLYLFLVSIKLLGSSFDAFGKERVDQWLSVADNPFVGLMLGILVTSIVQSSSFTTVTVVSLVGTGALKLEWAIPMIMGANIGTTVTNLLVAIGHVPRREEFRRAYAAAVVHDFFNLLTVAVLFPIELLTGYLRRTALWLADALAHVSPPQQHDHDFLGKILKPTVHLIRRVIVDPVQDASQVAGAILCLGVALFLLILALSLFVKLIRGALFGRIESVLDRFGFKRPVGSLFLGTVITAIVQSSSVTTSLVVPLAGAGLLTLQQVFPFMLGANVGTTVTALIGSMAAGDNPELHTLALTVALAHLLFNLTGILIFYPIRFFRHVPLRLAALLGDIVCKRRYLAPVFVVVIFFVLPLLCIWLWKVFHG